MRCSAFAAPVAVSIPVPIPVATIAPAATATATAAVLDLSGLVHHDYHGLFVDQYHISWCETVLARYLAYCIGRTREALHHVRHEGNTEGRAVHCRNRANIHRGAKFSADSRLAKAGWRGQLFNAAASKGCHCIFTKNK